MPQQGSKLAPHVEEIARALNNRVEMEQIEDELSRYLEYGVPITQAKRDIVRNHGGQLVAGEKKIKDLVPGESNVEVTAKILTVNPKEITVKGEQKTIWFGLIADESAKVAYTMWKDHGLERGNVYKIENILAKEAFRGDGVELNIGDYARVTKLDQDLDVSEVDLQNATSASAPARTGGPMKVTELQEGVTSATVTARVLDAREKVINTANGERTLLEGELGDASGKVQFTSWEPEKHKELLTKDTVVRIENGYVRTFRGVPQLNFGDNATLTVVEDAELPALAELDKPVRFALGDLERVGGSPDAHVEGVILEVKKGSGLIQRCPECNRVLQKRECRLHGRVQGTPDLRVKAVIDDGTGACTFFLGREGTEELLGKTLEECQEMAKEAMTMDVVVDELEEKLTGHTLSVFGVATSDDYGLQIIAREARKPEKKDPVAEARKLLDELGDYLAEAEVA